MAGPQLADARRVTVLQSWMRSRGADGAVSPAHWEAKARVRHRLVSRPSESRDSDMGQEIRSGGWQLRADARFAVGSLTLDASFYSERNRIKRGSEE